MTEDKDSEIKELKEQLDKEKNNATNFNDFMKAIGREQKTLLDLYNNHK